MIRQLVFALCMCTFDLATAANPCNPVPCSPDTSTDDAGCYEKATWVVEGRVLDVVDTTKKVCETGYGCANVWSNVAVVLDEPRVVKGSYPVGLAGRTVLVSGSHCWRQTTQLSSSQLGRRVRFFGTDEWLGIWTRPGFFLQRSIDPMN